MQKIERVKTGIPGLDELIEGGFVRDSSILVSGGTGTGKTIFCMQFLYNGATKYNEPGVFLTFEEDRPNLIRDASRFGWDLEKLEKEKKLIVAYEEPYNVEKFADLLEKHVFAIKAKRLVIDSTSVFGMAMENEHEVRMKLFDLMRLLRKLKITAVFTSEILEGSDGLSRFGVEEFVADGVLHMTLIEALSRRSLTVRKMRGTAHTFKPQVYDIDKNGFTLKDGSQKKSGVLGLGFK
ncbi:MAG: ATPase domain-containing protein [archaeon]